MGHRANLVIVNDASSYELYYCHWCANHIPHDVFWGPQYALSYIGQQQTVSENHWLDEIWAEGGVLVDLTRQNLLLYGGESLMFDIPLRRLYLELLSIVWDGWAIIWAHDGIGEIAEDVGLDRRDFFKRDDEFYTDPLSLNPPREKKYTSIVGSVVFEDQSLRLFPLNGLRVSEYLGYGCDYLVEAARSNPGVDHLSLHEWLESAEFPLGGFHVDVGQKRLTFWSADDPGVEDLIIELYRGWDLIWLHDGYEAQIALTRGKLMFPSPSTDALLKNLESILMSDYSGGLDSFLRLIDEKSKAGHDIQINPNALREDPQKIAADLKRQIFDQAVATWKQKQK